MSRTIDQHHEHEVPSQRARSALRVAALLALAAVPASAQLSVTSSSPALNAQNEAPERSIAVDFDRPLDPATLAEVRVAGAYVGPAAGAWTLEDGARRLVFTPARPFGAGELVTFAASHGLRAADGSTLRPAGWTLSYRVASASAGLDFKRIDVVPIRDDRQQPTRVYGGQICDLDRDGQPDVAVINEDTSDVRVLIGASDQSGLFTTFLSPAQPVGLVPSPCESGDLDGDGKLDLVTANANASTLSVLRGAGDGTFSARTDHVVGSSPHALLLLDIDGDGDLDLLSANTGSDDCSYLLNDGAGNFAPAQSFATIGNGEYALGLGDFDANGVQDFVVGTRFSEELVVVLRGDDGLFQVQAPIPSGGAVRMIAVGDLDGDGDLDLSCANSASNNGSILFGDGVGGFGAPVVYPMSQLVVATDLGDLDGDGDLDWVASCHAGGEWRIFQNDGAGAMSLALVVPAPQNPACAAVYDLDRDRDLDLVLFDELEDVLLVLENGDLAAQSMCFGTSTSCPCGNAGRPGAGCDNSFATGGAVLAATGRASVSGDTLGLEASGLPPQTVALFFQGTALVAQGGGTPFGDGVRCVQGGVIRLGQRASTAGVARVGEGIPGDPSLSSTGSIPPGGATRWYQAWYRNVAPFCTSATFNTTNALRVTWTG